MGMMLPNRIALTSSKGGSEKDAYMALSFVFNVSFLLDKRDFKLT